MFPRTLSRFTPPHFVALCFAIFVASALLGA
jgi:hypothetical protein